MPQITILSIAHSVALPVGSPLTSLEEDPAADGIIPFACCSGSCGACVIVIVDGMSNLDPPDDDERAFLDHLGHSHTRHRLACQSRIRGDVTIAALPPAE